MEHLFDRLRRNAESDICPCHMPGHKRRGWGELPEALYKMDITEIEGFDDLHQPTGILDSLQKEAARLYGAEESFYLVNGSTCGILSAVSTVLPRGGHILMARNCHRSAYHAAYLRELTVTYLYPPFLEEYDVFDAVTPRQVEAALEETSPEAVLIVSPTYEGRIAEVRAIAEIVHRKGIPLIVDEAHGAHLGLAEGFASNSCQAEADLVIHSVHKTLPSLTQTALLHVNGTLVDRQKLRRFLRIYQSSSPSYLLMAGIDNALRYTEERGKESFARFEALYRQMQDVLKNCRYLTFLPGEPERQDVGKLCIYTGKTRFTGKQVYDMLLDEYHIQAEMAAPRYVLAMFTVNDAEETYRRMERALLDIDRKCGEPGEDLLPGREYGSEKPWRSPEAIPLAEAWDRESETVTLQESAGRYAAEFVNLYPPGVPLLAPGERISEDMVQMIFAYGANGLSVQGIISGETESGFTEDMLIRVLKR